MAVSRVAVSRLVKQLESMRERPSMFVRRDDLEAIVHFFIGFRLAAHAALGVDQDWELEERILKSHGLKRTPVHPGLFMAMNGTPLEQVPSRLVEIEIDYWFKRYAGVARNRRPVNRRPK